MNVSDIQVTQALKTVFPGYSLLTKREKEFFELLKYLDHDSIWGEAVRSVLSNPNAHKFRLLISSLLSQAEDDQEIMMRILGIKTYIALINLKN